MRPGAGAALAGALAALGCTGNLPPPGQDAAPLPDAATPSGSPDAAVTPTDVAVEPDAAPAAASWRLVNTSQLLTARDLLSISGSDRDDVWAVSVNADILHFDGRSWRFDADSPILALHSVFAISATDAWVAAGGGRLFHFDGLDWKLVDAGSPERGPVRAVWGSAPNAVWIGGEFGFANPDLYFWDGRGFVFARQSGSGVPPNKVRALWGTGANDVWVVGTDDISHWNGAKWELARIPNRPVDRPFAAVWGSGPNDVWAVGDRVVLRWNGREWRDVPPQGMQGWSRVNGVWGSASNDVWMVGEQGDLFHSDGQRITRVASGTMAELRAIWGSSASDVWAVGAGPTMLHYTLAE